MHQPYGTPNSRIGMDQIPDLKRFLEDREYDVIVRDDGNHRLTFKKKGRNYVGRGFLSPDGGGINVFGPAREEVDHFLEMRRKLRIDKNAARDSAKSNVEVLERHMKIGIQDPENGGMRLYLSLPPVDVMLVNDGKDPYKQPITYTVKGSIADGFCIDLNPLNGEGNKASPYKTTNSGNGIIIGWPMSKLGGAIHMVPAIPLPQEQYWRYDRVKRIINIHHLPEMIRMSGPQAVKPAPVVPPAQASAPSNDSQAVVVAPIANTAMAPATAPGQTAVRVTGGSPKAASFSVWSELQAALSMVNDCLARIPCEVKLVQEGGKLKARANLTLETD